MYVGAPLPFPLILMLPVSVPAKNDTPLASWAPYILKDCESDHVALLPESNPLKVKLSVQGPAPVMFNEAPESVRAKEPLLCQTRVKAPVLFVL